MKSITGINGAIAPSPSAGVEPREPASQGPAVSGSDAPTSTPPPPTPSGHPTPTDAEVAQAVEELQKQLDDLPGADREVHLHYEGEDHTFVVEIRDKESGEVLQQFPPDILLNPGHGPADLLGTVVDRRS